ncbi:hypothetical protein BJ878DRAFT_222043 [Calycina marina]|uniref:Uncharacterized protein n=1 Tax=Calycina marina TaxID=1763456 RepID=A0A9P7Z839_9HELO|nr:hypothetical protein BJ878DRAFT_222043 [Calycina marina]
MTMRRITSCPLVRACQFHSFFQLSLISVNPRRHSSIEALQASLEEKLTTQPKNRIIDYLSPTPTCLLNIALADFLPKSYAESSAWLKDYHVSKPLPQAHHLVYFPTQARSSGILPDGTDNIQSPGSPYDRRMWAGGSLRFSAKDVDQVQLLEDGRFTRYCCTEFMTNVRIKGTEGDEKVFVTIKREIARVDAMSFAIDRTAVRDSRGHMTEQSFSSSLGEPALVEERNLVYLRPKSSDAIISDLGPSKKLLIPTMEPDHSFELTPDRALLFRFSALTFNAHAIHLDQQYCREVEGHRDLLVHGPLSLVLMFSILRSQLKEREIVLNFDYRNLAPLYVGERMRVCIKKDTTKKSRYDVWIEGKDGGYAVKGSATVGNIEEAKANGLDKSDSTS